METTATPFDLNRAIQQWRESLAQSPAIRTETLEELETHLRDSMARLQAKDLSAKEAFMIALERMGNATNLGKEFGKVNPQSAWLDRLLWALLLIQVLFVIQQSTSLCMVLIENSLGLLPIRYSGDGVDWAGLNTFALSPLIAFTLMTILTWRLYRSPKNRLKTFLEGILNRPGMLAVIILTIHLAASLYYSPTTIFSRSNQIHFPNAYYFQFIPGTLFYTGMAFFLACKRQLRKA